MILAGHQPEYLPYLGFCHKAMSVDIFMIVDHVQYGKKQFQNRNRIHANHGSAGWALLTVPVITHDRFEQRICDVEINNTTDWNEKHFKSIYFAYKGSAFFQDYISLLEDIYKQKWTKLALLNETLIKAIFQAMGINVKMAKSSDLLIEGKKTEMLINMCRQVGADGYLSGQGGKHYVNEEEFTKVGLTHQFLEFNHPVYRQKFKPFIPYMSSIDLLFNCGPQSKEIILAAQTPKQLS